MMMMMSSLHENLCFRPGALFNTTLHTKSSKEVLHSTVVLLPTRPHLVLATLCSSTSTSPLPLTSQQPHHFTVIDYLISSCGLSRDQAVRASKHLTRMKSSSNADSVLCFLRETGFSGKQIRSLISLKPECLCYDVENYLKPKFTALQDWGFSEPDLIQLVSKNPIALGDTDLRPKIEFFRSLLGTDEQVLKAFSRDSSLLSTSLENKLKPNVSLLRELGLSESQIIWIATRGCRLLRGTTRSIKEAIGRAEELGFSRSSSMFKYAVDVVTHMSKATVDAKFKLLKSLGWSEVQIIIALEKQPGLLALSENNIRCKMEFFTKEVGYGVSNLVTHPQFLIFSMEKRLIPRWSVLKVLKREQLPERQHTLHCIMNMQDNRFIERFLIPNNDEIPRLHEAYVLACGGKIPASIAASAGESPYIVCHPQILDYIIVKTSLRRWCVTGDLKREELEGYGLLNVMNEKENKFIEKFVPPYKYKVRGLHEAYVDSSVDKVPSL